MIIKKTNLIILIFFAILNLSLSEKTFSFTPLTTEESTVFPVVFQGIKDYVFDTTGNTWGSEVVKDILAKNKIDKKYLIKLINSLTTKKNGLDKFLYLPKDDQGDFFIEQSLLSPHENYLTQNKAVPKIAVHIFRFDVIEEVDDIQNDDIYCYFFTTDGIIPTGKTTSIYKNLNQNDSFFFSAKDRVVFPSLGVARAKAPTNHLIIDYGIIESDGDDIREMKKITDIVIDLALAVYAAIDPQRSPIIRKLRKEVKNLARALLSLNQDDRMATGSLYFHAQDLIKYFPGGRTFYHMSKVHHGKDGMSKWMYRINFRLLRGY